MTKENIRKLFEVASDEQVEGLGGEEYRIGDKEIEEASQLYFDKQKEGFWVEMKECRNGFMVVQMTNGKEVWAGV